MKKIIRRIVVVGFAIFVAVQFIPVARTNPPVTGDLPAPPRDQGPSPERLL